jgi:hypothetical protein
VDEAGALNLRQSQMAAKIRAIQNNKRSMMSGFSTDDPAV